MINDQIQKYSHENAARVDYYSVSHRDSQIHAEQNGNLERHKIVFNECAEYAFFNEDQAKHFAPVEACYKASPRRSRSNESTVDSSCTSLAFTQKGSTLWEICRDEHYRMRMHEQRSTRSDMGDFGRMASEKRNYVATPEEPAYNRYQHKVSTRRQQHRQDRRTP